MKTRIVALLLAFFLGLVGINNFYLGQNGTGVIKIILTITGVGAVVSLIWSLVEFINYIRLTDEAFSRKYNK